MATPRKLPRGITLNPSGRYRVKLYAQDREFSLGTFAALADAKAALAVAQGEVARGTFIPPAERRRALKAEAEAASARTAAEARTVRQLADAFLAWKEGAGLAWGSVYTYRRHLEGHFLPEFGDRAVGAVTAADLNAWLDRLEFDHGASVAPEVHGTVTALFKFAAGQARDLPRGFAPWIAASPVPALTRSRRREHREVTILSPSELARLSELMTYPEDRALILTAGWCALRIGEALALRRRHVVTDDAGRLMLRIETQVQARGRGIYEAPPKSEAGRRTIYVPALAREALTAHLAQHVGATAEALLFPRRGGGNRLNNPNTIGKRLKSAVDLLNREREDAGAEPLGRFTFHGLRHTGLTRMGQQGATEAELMAFAGHSDPKAVRIYQHAERNRLAALADRMTGEDA